MKKGRVRVVVALVATAVILGPLIWFWQASLLPDAYSVMSMGYVDTGGGPPASHDHGGKPVTELKADPNRKADVSVTLTARKGKFKLASGREVDGYTLNGTSPGPTIRATVGQMIEVKAVNESVPDGIALHWHGVDVPNAEDGVAGVTQDAIGVGSSYTYRFVADRPGTYWYHSHQVSHEQVRLGMLGALIIDPAPTAAPGPSMPEAVALVHLYKGTATVNGQEGAFAVTAAAGQTVRVRIINTENGIFPIWLDGTSYKVLAVDGNDVNQPGELKDTALNLPAGGRVDLAVTAPSRIEIGGSVAVTVGSGSATASRRPAATLDLLNYGAPQALPFDPDKADRHFTYDINRRPGFLDGVPGLFWTVNGHMYPDIPMFLVKEGDTVRMTIANHSGESHPMHLHGHRIVVLSRDGAKATGSPWWTDSLEVGSGETYEIAFKADNPGIWIDHCHNLPHAVDGLVAHLMYDGITTPFAIGTASKNTPE
jgi:FtsP/CotA-like multicopper oxidase with cupredoxin domain